MELDTIEAEMAAELKRFWMDSGLTAGQVARHVESCHAAVSGFRAGVIRGGIVRLLGWLEASGYSVEIRIARPRRMGRDGAVRLSIDNVKIL